MCLAPLAGTFTSVSAGFVHSCGVKTDGTLACWGFFASGQLGAAPAAPSPAPPLEGQVGTAYSHTFTSGAGSPSGSFSVSAGTLPPGLNLGSGGVLSGTPTAGGSYTFTASNGLFADSSEEFTITISSNTAPVANDDSYGVDEDQTLSVSAAAGVLANDTDAEGDDLTAELVDDVDNGELTLNLDGSFTYQPDDNYNGPDSFTYQANDGMADSNEATVSISVTAANDAPTVTVDGGGSCGSASDMRGTINLALSDPDDPPPESLTLTASSSNRSVLPNSNISFGGGTDASRTMTVSSLTGSGTSNVIITLSDEGDLNGTLLVRVISGSASNNTLTGSADADMIFARKGSDTLSAQGANDLMCGGNGNDRLTGGLGADRFGGGSGTDTATDFDASQGDTKAGIP